MLNPRAMSFGSAGMCVSAKSAQNSGACGVEAGVFRAWPEADGPTSAPAAASSVLLKKLLRLGAADDGSESGRRERGMARGGDQRRNRGGFRGRWIRVGGLGALDQGWFRRGTLRGSNKRSEMGVSCPMKPMVTDELWEEINPLLPPRP